MIRLAVEKDIDKIGDLLSQVDLVHHKGRPDIFKIGRKYNETELTNMLGDKSRPIFVSVDENAKKSKPGKVFVFSDGSKGTIVENPVDVGTEFRTLSFDCPITEEWFEKNGHIPLPPYIRREDTEEDSERYQNVYAKEVGSSACPTAGLHFTEKMLEKLKAKNIPVF